ARVFVPRFESPRRPISERIEELAVHQVAHVDGAHRPVVLHVVYLVEIAPSVGLRNSRKPRLVPGGRRILEGAIAPALDSSRRVQRLIKRGQCFAAVTPSGSSLGRLQPVTHLTQIEDHLKVLPVKPDDREEYL